MRHATRVTVTLVEPNRLKSIQAVIDGDLRASHVAERMGLTSRHVRRLVERYRTEGPVGLISRHRNRPSSYQLGDGVEQQIVTRIGHCVTMNRSI